MLMPIQMLPAIPVSGDAAKPTSDTVSGMPCHKMAPATPAIEAVKITDSKPSTSHCPSCMDMGHTAIGDGCGSCSCFSVSGALSVSVELIPLVLPSPEYTDNYRAQFSSVPSLPLLRPPQSV